MYDRRSPKWMKGKFVVRSFLRLYDKIAEMGFRDFLFFHPREGI
jgi:hypothetical protein